jgi:peptidoglycan/LPS O-acetylase OafA/YrhL
MRWSDDAPRRLNEMRSGFSGERNDALDGLRLLAVAAVMAFHFGLPGASGGFLGVDVFFVLSGYLITSLLLSRMSRRGLDVVDFWNRRLRRLLPALLVVIGVLVAWGALVAPVVSRDGLRGDITATLLYVANWHFISTSSYFASDGVPSPLEHMWSLAVEEQFYLVWPLLLALTAACVRRPRQRALAVGGLAAAGLVASAIRLAAVWASSGQERAYLGTDARIFEPLTGALLAAVLASAFARRRAAAIHWCLLAAGSLSLAGASATLGSPTGATRAYADGGAVVVAVATAAVIAAIATRDSVATTTLASAPLAYLGRLSYAMYLWHWPLQVWTGRYGWWDLSTVGAAIRVSILTGLTIGLAALSYHLVEKPIRYGRLSRILVPRRMVVAVPLVLGAMVLINSSVVVPRAGATSGRVTRTIVLVGDSVPQRLAPDLARVAARQGYVVISATRGSCPATGVAVVGVTGKPLGAGRACATDVPARQNAAVAKYHPALVIWWSRYELADRVDARGRPVRFATPAYWALQKHAFARRTAALTRDGAIVVAVQIERSGLGMATRCTPEKCGPFLERLIEATAAQNTWNAFLASHSSGPVRSISIQSLVCHDTASPCNDRLPDGSLARPDGTHYSAAAAPPVAQAVINRSLAAAGLQRPPATRQARRSPEPAAARGRPDVDTYGHLADYRADRRLRHARHRPDRPS